jgi:IstB-like ATP binding protein
MLITSQLPRDKWHDVIGEPTFADAILDRIGHNAYRLELDGPSMRKLQTTEQAETDARSSAKEARTIPSLTKPKKGDQK